MTADSYLAKRLSAMSRHALAAATYSNGNRAGGHPALPAVPTKLLADACHFALLGMVAGSLPIKGDLDGERQSLIVPARTLQSENVRRFEAFELEQIANLDIVHMRPIASCLLPDETTRDIFRGAYTFVERFVGELQQKLMAESAAQA